MAPRPVIDTQGNNVEVTGVIYGELFGSTSPIGFTKMGTGELLLSNPNTDYLGLTNIAQGTVRVNSVVTAPGQSYSALCSGNIQVQNGGTLHIDNVSIGVDQNQTTINKVGWVDLFSGSTLKGSGNASYERGTISAVLNFSSGSYSAGSITFATVNATDVLAIKDAVRQYDPNYLVNEYGNWDPATRQADPSKLITAHVSGPGVVKLQDGGVSADTVFGGAWSVDSGVLQVGPCVANPTPDPTATSTGWGGPYGQPLNALGFHTPNGQAYPSVYADPDLPNAVTVNAGGTLAVAVDQVNTNPNTSDGSLNGTPKYLRNPITLNGGAIASTGYEMSFGANPTDPQGMPTGTAVTARLGGDFTVASGATSKVLTYDSVGGTGARTVELVGGSRYIAYTTNGGWTAGSTITYSTNWGGTLTVDSDGTTGGEFNIRRTAASAPVTVTPGAALNILAGATVNIMGGYVDSHGSYLPADDPDPTRTYQVARNNMLKDDGSANAVAISNAGQFNVDSGVQTVGVITGTGTTSINADVNNPGTTLNTPQINQAAVTVNGGTLSIGAYNSSVGTVTLISGAITGSSGTLTSTSNFDVRSGLISSILAGSVGLNKNTSGVVKLAAADTYNGATSLQGGTIKLAANEALPSTGAGNTFSAVAGTTLDLNGYNQTVVPTGTFACDVINSSGVDPSFTVRVPKTYTVSHTASMTGAGVTVAKTGGGKLTLAGPSYTYTGVTTAQAGTLQLGAAAWTNALANAGVNVQNDWTTLITPAGSAAAVQTELANSFAAGWGSGGKIFSTTCAASGGSRTLGWLDQGAAGVEVMQTIPGDCNLNGTVGFDDFNVVLTHYGLPGDWSTGDFNYNGTVDFQDFNAALTYYGTSMVPVPGLDLSNPNLDGAVLGALRAHGLVGVPEPGTLALLAAGLIGLLAYAWRKRK